MKQTNSGLKTLSWTTLRLLGNTPGYFFLIWRWTFWLFAFIWIIYGSYTPQQENIGKVLLIITFIHTLVITLYTPVFQLFLLWLPGLPRLNFLHMFSRQRGQQDIYEQLSQTDTESVTPLLQTRHTAWIPIIYGFDVLICGLVTYYGGIVGFPPFGYGSPFYRYGFSAAYAAAFTYKYKGGLIAALGYEVFILLGTLLPPPGSVQYTPGVIDLESSFIDVPIAVLLAAYLASLLTRYIQTNRDLKYNVDSKDALVKLGETLVRGAEDEEYLLRKSAEQMRQGGHFHHLLLVPIEYQATDTAKKMPLRGQEIYSSSVQSEVANTAQMALITQVHETGQKIVSFELADDRRSNYQVGLARLYIPLYKDGSIRMVIGAENRTQEAFAQRQEEFLVIAGTQLIIALENIQLLDEAAKLARETERVRIAREIHDGIAQLIYMLSLNSETSTAIVQKMQEMPLEETGSFLQKLQEQLERQVMISKQALLETRQYIFSLKPLMSGTTTLKQMLSNQIQEFELISGLKVQLEMHGERQEVHHNRTQMHKVLQTDMAIFRIVQEALNNTYKHAQATQVWITLNYQPTGITVEICDNGQGLAADTESKMQPKDEQSELTYSGNGLRNMQERVHELDGVCTFMNISTGGFKVSICIPV